MLSLTSCKLTKLGTVRWVCNCSLTLQSTEVRTKMQFLPIFWTWPRSLSRSKPSFPLLIGLPWSKSQLRRPGHPLTSISPPRIGLTRQLWSTRRNASQPSLSWSRKNELLQTNKEDTSTLNWCKRTWITLRSQTSSTKQFSWGPRVGSST